MKKKSFFAILSLSTLICFSSFSFSSDTTKRQTAKEYIEKYKDVAIKEMRLYKIPASITLAQGILESGSGNSRLAVKANNHFGIKCHKGWTGKSIYEDDDAKNECFRKYKNAEESFKDHSVFLSTRTRYEALFELKLTDYKGWAKGLKKAGYATNPKYPQLLIKLIEDNELYKYDEINNLIAEKKQRKRKKSWMKKNRKDKKNNIEQDNKKANDVINPDFEPIEAEEFALESANSRKLYKNNAVIYIIFTENDDVVNIAQDFDMMPWQVYKYNDLKKGDKISVGDKLYIKPKKRWGTKNYHIVIKGESMYSISQDYGIKLKHLYRKNHMEIGQKPDIGQKLWLKRTKPL